MLPEYTLKGRSAIYLNGKKLDISTNAFGISGSGTVSPDNISATAPRIAVVPLSSKVKKVNKLKSVQIAVTKNADRSKLIKNNKNALNEIGGSKLYGFGNNKAIIIIGKNLKKALDVLVDNIFIYHLKYIESGLTNS